MRSTARIDVSFRAGGMVLGEEGLECTRRRGDARRWLWERQVWRRFLARRAPVDRGSLAT